MRRPAAVILVITAAVVTPVVLVLLTRSPSEPDVRVPSAVALEQLRPQPADAKDDRPAFYDDGSGCQVEDGDPVPMLCTSGDESAHRTLMLVGDSKIAQWQTAYADIARSAGWRVVTATKSACPFADVELVSDGEVRTDCRDWGRSVLREVIAEKPDLVVTSQRADRAVISGDDQSTRGEMVRGLHAYWQRLLDAGIPVVVQLDNPFPTTHPVYRCVEQNADRLSRCAFRFEQGNAESAAPTLQRAARTLPGVRVLDMSSVICPDDGWCPAVIDDVLVYRAGSHLTRTFTVHVERQLAEALERATKDEFAATPP